MSIVLQCYNLLTRYFEVIDHLNNGAKKLRYPRGANEERIKSEENLLTHDAL